MNLLILALFIPVCDMTFTPNKTTSCLPPIDDIESIEFPGDLSELPDTGKYQDYIDPETFFDDLDQIEEWEEAILKARPFDPLVDENLLIK